MQLTVDMGGAVKFGPDTIGVDSTINYNSSISPENFCASVWQNFPCISERDLAYSYSGVRPKLKIGEKIVKDFVFTHDFDKKLISALGIESPGLTASLGIAKEIFVFLNEHTSV